VSEKVQTPNGLVEDTIPEDQSLVLNTTPGRRKIKREGSVASGSLGSAATPGQPVRARSGLETDEEVVTYRPK
jgi:hypothetical protein